MSHLTDGPIDTPALVRATMRRSDGACVVFEGVVRDHHDGKAVESIFYDAYRPMAEKEIAKIISDIASQYPDVKTAVVHRLGQLGIGDVSISIVCTSPHRAEAYEASRLLIDRIKETPRQPGVSE